MTGSSLTRSLSHITARPPNSAARYDAVGDLEPLELAEAAPSPGAPQVADRRRRRHRSATLTPNLGAVGLARGIWASSVSEHETGDAQMSEATPYLAPMSVEAMQVFTAVLAIAAAALAVLVVVARLLRGRSSVIDDVAAAVGDASLWIAFLIAAVATAGSLYFSEVADYVPCRLCWFQRIAMYPLAVILLVAAVRRDRDVRWYVIPVAGLGACVSVYHYLVEWHPQLEGDACDPTNPCSLVWFRQFGFVTLALMALCGFVAIIALLATPTAELRRRSGTTGDVMHEDKSTRPAQQSASSRERPDAHVARHRRRRRRRRRDRCRRRRRRGRRWRRRGDDESAVDPYRPVSVSGDPLPEFTGDASRSGGRAAGPRRVGDRLRRQRGDHRPGAGRADDDRHPRPLVPALQRRGAGAQRLARLRRDPRRPRHRGREHRGVGRRGPTSRPTSGSSTSTGSGRCSPTTSPPTPRRLPRRWARTAERPTRRSSSSTATAACSNACRARCRST